MKKAITIISLFPILPSIAIAQTLSAQGFIAGFLVYTNKVFMPGLIGIAFLLFAINVIRFFVINGSNEDGRENAKNLAIYSVLAFVVLLIFWGIVNLFASSIGFNGDDAPNPDYLEINDKELNTTPVRNPNAPSTPSANMPQNILPPQYGGPNTNVQCPPGSSFNPSSNSCDYQ